MRGLWAALLVVAACEKAGAPVPEPHDVKSSGVQRMAVVAVDAAVPAQDAGIASLVIEVPAKGDALVGGKTVADSELPDVFRAAFLRDPNTQVVIEADRDAPHARIVAIMDMAKAAGLTHLALGVAAPPPDEIHIAVTPTGERFVNGVAVTTDAELDAALVAAHAQNPDMRVMVKADQSSKYADIIALMDHAKQAGLTNIMLETTPP